MMLPPICKTMIRMEISQRINPPPAPPRGAGALIHVTSNRLSGGATGVIGVGARWGKGSRIVVAAKWSSPRRWITSHAEREKANHPVVWGRAVGVHITTPSASYVKRIRRPSSSRSA